MPKQRVAYYYQEDVVSRPPRRALQRPVARPDVDATTHLHLPRTRRAQGHHYYGPGHPMKPIRMKLAHHLVLGYGLHRKMECFRPHLASAEEMTAFHSDDYVDFLRRVTPETVKTFTAQQQRCAWARVDARARARGEGSGRETGRAGPRAWAGGGGGHADSRRTRRPPPAAASPVNGAALVCRWGRVEPASWPRAASGSTRATRRASPRRHVRARGEASLAPPRPPPRPPPASR